MSSVRRLWRSPREWVTPASGKGALGTRRFRELNTHPDSELDFMRG